MGKDKKYKNKRTKNFMYEDGSKTTKITSYNKDKNRRENKIDLDLVDTLLLQKLGDSESFLDDWYDNTNKLYYDEDNL